MSDTGGGHRASANALRDAFDELYPGQIEVDIVDIFTDYGPFFPFNSFVPNNVFHSSKLISLNGSILLPSVEVPSGKIVTFS